MKIIVGLGNPGEKYANTRHNAGFMFLEYLYNKSEVIKPWKNDKYSNSEISQIELPAILAKPQTFMNNSGQAVKKLTTNYKLGTTSLLIAHDDLDIPLGQFKMSFGKGPKLHNGIISIEEHLHTADFWRIRIGVDNRKGQKIDGETYVLQNFLEDEKKQLLNVFSQLLQRLTEI